MNSRAIKLGAALALPISLIAVTCLAAGCAQHKAGGVDENWGSAYRETMEDQIASPPSEGRNGIAVEGFDSLTADIVLENYQDDVRRTTEEAREMFIIDTGVR